MSDPWDEEEVTEAKANGAVQPGMITDAADVKTYVLAGNAHVTIVSKKTGTRFTYRVRSVPEDNGKGAITHFVSLLTAPDNERSYTYFGWVANFPDNGLTYRYGHRSTIAASAPGVVAFDYFFRHVVLGGKSPADATLDVYHEGRCGACGRKLTVPESIARGLGPECAGKRIG